MAAQPETTDTGHVTKGPYVHPDFPELSEAELKDRANRFNIDDHLVSLAFSEPFYGDIIRALHKTATDAVPTAGVICKDDVLHLYYNKLFMAGYNPKVVRGILMHEAMHLVLEHTTSRRYEPHMIWNWATDLAINGSLPGDMLPECGIIPGRALKFPADFNTWSAERQETMKKISTLIEGLPDNLSSEQYFGILMEDPDVQDMMSQGGSGGVGEMDDHDGWDQLSDEEREYIASKVRQIVKNAVDKADSKNSWGSIPAHMREEIRRKVRGEIDWRTVLRRFVGYTHRADRMSSVYRANRKYPGIHAGHSRDYKPRLAVYVDQSGSVSDESLELFFGEMASLSSRVEITVFHFDTEVDEESKTIWRRGAPIPTPHRTRCGGTCFDAPTKHANAQKFDGYIIMTDGGAARPERSRKRRCFVLGPGDELAYADPDTRDVVVKMKRKIA